jgi:hypothetical protein
MQATERKEDGMSLTNELVEALESALHCAPGEVFEGYGQACNSPAHYYAMREGGRCEFSTGLANTLAPVVADMLAKVWDEGEAAGLENGDDGHPDPLIANPYRIAREVPGE